MTSRTMAIIVMAAVLVGVALTFWLSGTDSNRISYSRFLDQARQGEIAAVAITPGNGAATVQAWTRNGRAAEESVLPGDYREALAILTEQKVNIEIRPAGPAWTNAIPFLLLLSAWVVMMIVMKNRPGGLPPAGWFR